MLPFQVFLEQKGVEPNIDVVAIGGFFPGQAAVSWNMLEASKEELLNYQTTTVSPILYDSDDIQYILQFPVDKRPRAMNYRFSKLLFWAKEKHDKGEEIPNIGTVTMVGQKKGQMITTKYSGLDGKGIKLNIKHLLDRLQSPRDLDALSKMTPETAKDYTAGLHGYDLSDVIEDKENQESFSKGYIPQSLMTARDSSNNWMEGVVAGFLGSGNFPFRKVSVKGGRPKLVIDWNGELRSNEAGTMWVPTLTQKHLVEVVKRISPGAENLVTPDGQITWKYERNGKPNSFTDYVPLLVPGKLISAEPVREYNKNFDEMKQFIKENASKKVITYLPNGTIKLNSKELKERLDATMKAVSSIKTYNEKDWNRHRYNKERDESGKRLYPRLHSDVEMVGGFQPNNNQPEQIQGTKRDEETAMKHFFGYPTEHPDNPEESIWKTTDTKGEQIEASAIRDGVRDQIKRIGNTHEATIMKQMFDEIVSAATTHITGKLGEPYWKRQFDILRTSSDPEEKDKAYKIAYNEIRHSAKMYANTIWQLDLGRGSRRRRGNQNASTMSINQANNDTDQGMEAGIGQQQSTAGKGELAFGGELAQGGRKRGERSAIRPSILGAGKSLFFAHHLGGIRQRIIDNMADSIKTLESSRKNNDQLSEKETELNLVNDLTIRGHMLNEYIELFISQKVANGDIDNWTMQDAYQWADMEMRKELTRKGVSVSKEQIPVGAPSKQQAADAQKEKEMFVRSAQTIRQKMDTDSAFGKFLSQPGQIEDLMANPKKLDDAIMAAKQMAEKDERARDLLFSLQDIKNAVEEKSQLHQVHSDADVKQARYKALVDKLVASPQAMEKVKMTIHSGSYPELARALQDATRILATKQQLKAKTVAPMQTPIKKVP